MRRLLMLLAFILILSGTMLLVLGVPRSVSLPLLAVSQDGNASYGVVARLEARVMPGSGNVYADTATLSRLDTQATTSFAVQTACTLARLDCAHTDLLIRIRANAPVISGPSASAAMGIATLSLETGIPLANTTSITGTLSSTGLIGPVGGVQEKLDAAAAAGIKRVVVSRFSNLSNLTLPEGLELVPVATLREAAAAFNPAFTTVWPSPRLPRPPRAYQEGMRRVADFICTAARDGNATLLTAAENALRENASYAAASYCFIAYRDLLRDQAEEEIRNGTSLRDLLVRAERDASAAERRVNASRMAMRSVLRVQLASILRERVEELHDTLRDAQRAVEENNTEAFLDAYALARARALSIQGWLLLKDFLPAEPVMPVQRLREACEAQLGLARERMSFALLFDPTLAEGLERAQQAAVDDPAYCAFKAAKTRAEADMTILFSMLPEDILEEYARVNHAETARLLALRARDAFPMMAYAYYEYAGSLLEENLTSLSLILLYDAYAAELARLYPDMHLHPPGVRALPRMLGFAFLMSGVLMLLTILAVRDEPLRVSRVKKRRR